MHASRLSDRALEFFCVLPIDPIALQLAHRMDRTWISKTGMRQHIENGVIHCSLPLVFRRMKSCHVSVCAHTRRICEHFRAPLDCPLCQSNFCPIPFLSEIFYIYISHDSIVAAQTLIIDHMQISTISISCRMQIRRGKISIWCVTRTIVISTSSPNRIQWIFFAMLFCGCYNSGLIFLLHSLIII